MNFGTPFLFLLLNACFVFSQKQNNIWYFGNNAGIDFNSGTAVAISNGIISALEGSAIVCDTNGNLLFYTDGIIVRDKNHNVMPNGTGLLGGASSSQAALIVPKPGSCSIYYIFTIGDHVSPSDFRYSVIDMCLNGGNGDVITGQKNIFLHQPCGEKITAVPHSNGTDIWVITHELGNNNFRAYSVTPAGVNITPVISGTGSTHQTNQMIGYIRASHNGTKLACAVTFGSGLLELFDFNPSTGVVSNFVNLTTLFSLPAAGFYGLDFSINDALLYATNLWGTSQVYQLDLTTNTPTILASIPGNYNYGAILLGGDGKMYVARQNQSYLDIINNPNISGVGCNYASVGFNLSPGTSSNSGLPNFIPGSYISPVYYPFSFSFGNDTILCLGDSLVLTPNIGCNATYLWQDGSTNPTYVADSTGTYWVEVTNICGTATDTINISFFQSINASITGNSTICSGTSTTLTASGGSNYSWNTGATTSSISVITSATATYSVIVSMGLCSDSASITVIVYPSPIANAGTDITINIGDSTSLSASGGISYSWSNGATSSTVMVNPTTTTIYAVIVSDANGCTDVDTVVVYVLTIDCSNIEQYLFIPNVFSPNDDGDNDVLSVFYSKGNSCIKEFQLAIYNRWGQKVFETTNITDAWDGTLNGKNLHSAVFIYYCRITSISGQEIIKKGNITLLR